MNCVRTSVGKPSDELRGYNGLVDCIGKTAADRVSKRVAVWSCHGLVPVSFEQTLL
jgi:hypothetical protein